jgi:hypothetical protein
LNEPAVLKRCRARVARAQLDGGAARFYGHGRMTREECFQWLEAARTGDLALVRRFLLRDGWDINATNSHGLSALHEAAYHGHADVVRALVASGADLELRDRNDLTPLAMACNRGGAAAEAGAMALIAAGADVTATRAADGLTPLGAAAGPGAGSVALLAALVERGASVNGPAGTDWPPLLDAAKNNHPAAVAFLVEHGANLHWRCQRPLGCYPSWKGRTVREIAEIERYPTAGLLAKLEARQPLN